MTPDRILALSTFIPAALVTGLWGYGAAAAFVLGALWLMLLAFASDGVQR